MAPGAFSLHSIATPSTPISIIIKDNMPIAPSPLPRARKRLQQENAHVSLTSREKEKSMECNRQHGLTHEEGVTTVAPAMGRDGRREGRWRFLRRTGTEFFALFVMVAVVPVLLGRFQGGERATSESAQAKWSDREQGQRFADVLPKREGFEARDALVRGKADQLVVELRRPSPEAVALVQEIVEVVFPMPEKSLIAIGGAEDAERLEALRSVERVSPLPAKAKMGVPTEASSSGNGDNATTTNLIASLPPRMPGGMEARATDVHQAAKVVASSLGCSRGNGGIDEPAANGGSGLCEGVQADGKRSLTIVGVPPRSLLRAATELSALAVVHFVSLPGRLRALETENVQVAGAAQSGEESEHPLWDEGLDGEGEIIAIGDTVKHRHIGKCQCTHEMRLLAKIAGLGHAELLLLRPGAHHRKRRSQKSRLLPGRRRRRDWRPKRPRDARRRDRSRGDG